GKRGGIFLTLQPAVTGQTCQRRWIADQRLRQPARLAAQEHQQLLGASIGDAVLRASMLGASGQETLDAHRPLHGVGALVRGRSESFGQHQITMYPPTPCPRSPPLSLPPASVPA